MRPLTVLVVDDELTVRVYAGRALRRAGHVVLEADSGESALELLAGAEPVDVVVTDVVMPGIDGPTLVRTLRRERPDLPVVFVSGYADARLHGPEVEAASTRFLPKPFSPTDLRVALQEVVGGELDGSGRPSGDAG